MLRPPLSFRCHCCHDVILGYITRQWLFNTFKSKLEKLNCLAHFLLPFFFSAFSCTPLPLYNPISSATGHRNIQKQHERLTGKPDRQPHVLYWLMWLVSSWRDGGFVDIHTNNLKLSETGQLQFWQQLLLPLCLTAPPLNVIIPFSDHYLLLLSQ